MPGNLELAKKVYAVDAEHWKHPRKAAKAGFKHIGSGGTREVYLGPDNVAYKVGDETCNLTEAKATRRYRGSAKLAKMDIVVPRARTFRVDGGYHVLGMDYVPPGTRQVRCKSYEIDDVPRDQRVHIADDCDCKPRGRACFGKVLEYVEEFGIDDMFSGNIIYSTDKKYYLIDLGYQGAFDHDD